MKKQHEEYRAWHKKDKTMLPVTKLEFNEGPRGTTCSVDTEEDGDEFGYANTFELMRYSKLRDKKKKKIFAGDIIKYDDDDTINHWVSGQTALIVDYGYKMVARLQPFDKETIGGQNILSEDFAEYAEVIGDMHRNPELLK